ncbi:type II CRISPR-associated endonuclease Cas1 [Basilea psittacipulmonis]|uniref:CRISPR-associated endonuclease Cas1 n=1 Tax=Basilea psittacipulmonis DSM 24701 TaxID=1072685 RepID=A0A077DCT8_9BURK|nr:type II CRISPR-associated endonuclease Cas1 [Basilea psittacipulmonis]AIL32419.1 CRISPR-associated protein Cas1 [Basilea psittacipulmonis DSM 24701]
MWRSVVINQASKLSLWKQQLYIQQKENYLVPLEDVAVILIEAKEVTITAPLLSAIAEYGITLLTCDQQFLPCGQWLPFSQYHRSLKILNLQLKMSEPLKKQLWQKIVQQKIKNQAWILDYSGHDIAAHRLNKLANEVKSGDKELAESQAASIYFKVLFKEGFNRKNEHPVNAYLNYGYTILRSAVARSLTQYGFLSIIGIHHRSELNAFNLADDFIEPFRQLVDLAVYHKMIAEEINLSLSVQDRHELVKLLNYDIRINNKNYNVLAAIDKTIQSFQASMIHKDSSLLKLPEMVCLKEHAYE